MNSNSFLPLERNRYYVGKLLTSADFQAEQNYLGQKHRFVNHLMFGEGVVCGLGVYNLDDLSIMVDSGVGVDGLGREVVLERALVKKLAAIDGFEALRGERALLCLRYGEEPVHPVYAVSGKQSGEGYEYNRIRETCSLFVKDWEEPAPVAEAEFFSIARLYEGDGWRITLRLPAQAACGQAVRLRLEFACDRPLSQPLGLQAILQTPALTAEDGRHETTLSFRDLQPLPGQPVVRDLWFTAQSAPVDGSVLIFGAQTTKITLGEDTYAPAENLLVKFSVTDADAEQLVAQAVAGDSLEARDLLGYTDCIPLAELRLQRTKSAYLIEGVQEQGVKRYIRTAAAEAQRSEFAAWYELPSQSVAAPQAEGPSSEAEGGGQRLREPIYASGVCEIPLGSGARKGQTVYSDEILHGLGKGTVFVQVGVEYLAEDPKLGAAARSTVYGDAGLFAAEAPPVVYAQTAVKVMNDRGSFVVAAKLDRDTTMALLTLRWVALRLPVGEEQSKLQKLAGKSIAAVTPTVVLATKESHFFNVRFKNMEPCTLSYELTEADAGSITTDGVYTAPAREGVYEIRISCAEMPLISTYAYAVVKKRDNEPDAAQ